MVAQGPCRGSSTDHARLLREWSGAPRREGIVASARVGWPVPPVDYRSCHCCDRLPVRSQVAPFSQREPPVAAALLTADAGTLTQLRILSTRALFHRLGKRPPVWTRPSAPPTCRVCGATRIPLH